MLIIIGGATATGKSDIAVRLAEAINGEIVSADSMQIYRRMDIGTAKVTQEEMRNIPHHLINIVEPWESFTLSDYINAAEKCINDIENRGKTPIICGGTGLYISALIYGYSLSSYDSELRRQLNEELEANGIKYMYDKLLRLDPKAAVIHINNKKRVIRALEAIIGDGKSILDKDDKKSAKPHLLYALDIERPELYKKIDNRVDLMFEKGLTEEVDRLINIDKLTFDMQSMQAIGYKEFADFYNCNKSLEELKSVIKQHSRNYAKKQFTWFKHIDTCKWLKKWELDAIIKDIDTHNSK